MVQAQDFIITWRLEIFCKTEGQGTGKSGLEAIQF